MLKGINCDTLAMCAVCSCLCGDRTPPPPTPPHMGAWPVPVTLAESKLLTWEEATPDGTSGTASVRVPSLCPCSFSHISAPYVIKCPRSESDHLSSYLAPAAEPRQNHRGTVPANANPPNSSFSDLIYRCVLKRFPFIK